MTLNKPYLVTRIEVWNRNDQYGARTNGAVIALINQDDVIIFTKTFGTSERKMDITPTPVNIDPSNLQRIGNDDVGVPVDGSWQHPTNSNSLGLYFKYDIEKWRQYFGTAPTSVTVVQVKQCRNGAEVWSGQVMIAPSSSNGDIHYAPHGRRNSGQSNGQWEKYDYVVKVSVFDV